MHPPVYRALALHISSDRKRKVEVAMVKIPFIHFHHERSDSPRHMRKRFTWLQREDSQFSHGRSSLFYLAHDTPQAPSVTCIQGHEILPGETTCIHGHPAG